MDKTSSKSRSEKSQRTSRVRPIPSAWSFRKTYRGSATDERIYLCVVLAESISVAALALAAWGVTVARLPPSTKQTMTVSVYMAIFVLARIFSLAYCLDAIRARNVVQLVLHIAFQFCMIIYAISEIPQVHSAFKSLDDANRCRQGGSSDCLVNSPLYYQLKNVLAWPPIISGFATAVYCVMARRLYMQFGWEECRLLNASLEMKRMYRMYEAMVSLLKMLAFFASAFCMAYIVLVTSLWKDRTEFVITVVALPIFYPTILVTGWAVTHEDVILMVISLVLLVVGEAYFVYKLASLWLPRTAWLYKNTRITLAVFSMFSVLLLLVVIVNGCVCLSNFGKGLLPAHMERQKKAAMFFRPCVGRREKDEEQAIQQPLVID